jgi:ABC-type dipeptide/oligopeptide/nickel transport system ATPase component
MEIENLIKENLKDRVLGIFGKSGSGKSVLTSKILQSKMVKEINKKVIVVSATPNLYIDKKYFDYKISEFEKIPKLFASIENGEKAFINIINEKILNVIALECLLRKNFLLVLDDVDGYLTKYNKKLEFILTYHRHKLLSMIYITRRPQNIPPLLILNTHMSFSFKFTEPNSLEVISKNFPSEKENTKEIISNLNYDEHDYYFYCQSVQGVVSGK